MDVQCVTRRLPEQVQRERTAAEGAAGSSHLAQQTERLSEEEPRGSAAAAREVHLSVFISASACSHEHIHQSAAASVLNRMVSVLEEREQEIGSLQSDLQQKNSDITGWCDISTSWLTHTHIHKKIPSIQFCCACFQSGLRCELRAEEEKLKEKDQERRDLEEMVDVLRTELNKTEQARKDASIKVRPPSPPGRQTQRATMSQCPGLVFALLEEA